jgi:hypothetical protein
MPRQVTRRSLLIGVGALRAQTVFRESITGRVILPGDADYHSARRVFSFNPQTDKYPQMIVRCAEPEDAAKAILYAREKLLDVAVRSGGHDLLGASVCDGLVIDLSHMNAISMDRDARTVRVEAGARTAVLNDATQASELAVPLGCHPGVGVAGLTLGGGIGWLTGKHGATCDNLLGADVVTADGKMLHASATENSDLFWALRGGGGNFGIVTSLEYQLHLVSQVVGGIIAYRTGLDKFLRFYSGFMKNAPAELAVELNILLNAQPTIIAMVCWSGDPADGQRVLRPLRSFGPPEKDLVDTVPYLHLLDRFPQLGPLLGPPPRRDRKGPPAIYWRGGSLPALTNSAADQLSTIAQEAPPGSSIGVGHYMHGQVCRVAQDATPLPRVAGQFTYFINGSWYEANRAEASMAWVDHSWTAMKRHSSKGTYINYLSTNDAAAVRASYGQNFGRLAELKRKYDPANFFRNNRNIRLSSASAAIRKIKS